MSHNEFITSDIAGRVIAFLTFHHQRCPFNDIDVDWTMDRHYHKNQVTGDYTKLWCPCCQARKGGLANKPQSACDLCGTAWILSATSMQMMNIVRMVGSSQRRYDWDWRDFKDDIYTSLTHSFSLCAQGGDKPRFAKVGYEPHCGQGCDEQQSWSSNSWSWWNSGGGDWQAKTEFHSSWWHIGGGDWHDDWHDWKRGWQHRDWQEGAAWHHRRE